MIARPFRLAAALFVLYNVVLLPASVRRRSVAQSQWKEHLAKAQEYRLAKPFKPDVIVGSSLSDRLAGTSLQTDFYHLSLAGDGPLTGVVPPPALS